MIDFNVFFHLSRTCRLIVAPVLVQKSQGMQVVHTFWRLYCKKSAVTLIFYLMILIKTIHPFNEKKKMTKAMSSILEIP